ncbi:hypothetical protein [Paraburkholderia sacchari]|uniref:hypothetical protein n=1 Tax=Paraburkholderia sacchari TaxID=159450 RepID=UPI003D9684B9
MALLTLRLRTLGLRTLGLLTMRLLTLRLLALRLLALRLLALRLVGIRGTTFAAPAATAPAAHLQALHQLTQDVTNTAETAQTAAISRLRGLRSGLSSLLLSTLLLAGRSLLAGHELAHHCTKRIVFALERTHGILPRRSLRSPVLAGRGCSSHANQCRHTAGLRRGAASGEPRCRAGSATCTCTYQLYRSIPNVLLTLPSRRKSQRRHRHCARVVRPRKQPVNLVCAGHSNMH